MKFTAYGHPNILATHPTTIEFTKDKELSSEGDCIIGVKADFLLKDIKKIVAKEQIKITVKVDKFKEEISAQTNRLFNHDTELVIRKSDFLSDRTLGIKADKAAVDLARRLVEKLKDPKQKIEVEIIAL
ncbi:DUF371 domain-containing protein [Candidatus Woesearchaeota archaeon]|nr:DUF371 domain-containing protein [Candidatus Woesearchaeota archaeon]